MAYNHDNIHGIGKLHCAQGESACNILHTDTYARDFSNLYIKIYIICYILILLINIGIFIRCSE